MTVDNWGGTRGTGMDALDVQGSYSIQYASEFRIKKMQ